MHAARPTQEPSSNDPQSQDGTGKLLARIRKTDADDIPDFSYAGYGGGGVPYPEVPVIESISPSGGPDDTNLIQAAIDRVSARKLSAQGVRGAVKLGCGTFPIQGVLTLAASGVVLRGSGASVRGTVLQFVGKPRQVFHVGDVKARRRLAREHATITSRNIPVGTHTFEVDKPEIFNVGDAVVVGRPVTKAWLAVLGMDKLERDGVHQTWIAEGSYMHHQRVITAISGNHVTLDAPVIDSFRDQHIKPMSAIMSKYSCDGCVTNVGLEHLRAIGAPRSDGGDWQFLEMHAAVDAWVLDVDIVDFAAGIEVDCSSRRITIEDVNAIHTPVEFHTGAAPTDFNVNGTQVLHLRCSSKGGNKIFFYCTGAQAAGPNVVLNFKASGGNCSIQPHMRWATGLLVDSCDVGDGKVCFTNRGVCGSGHGWAIAWGVVWNCTADVIQVERPPGAMNWAVGCKGATKGDGSFDLHGTPVQPGSLYLAQLKARLEGTATLLPRLDAHQHAAGNK